MRRMRKMKKSKEQVEAEANMIAETFKWAYKLGYDDAVKDIKEPDKLHFGDEVRVKDTK